MVFPQLRKQFTSTMYPSTRELIRIRRTSAEKNRAESRYGEIFRLIVICCFLRCS